MQYITIHLMGGLGNQLFQIFATIAYAKKHNMTVVFPYSKVLTSGVKRPTYWHSFLKDIENLTANNPEYETVTRYLDKFITYNEKGFHYVEIPKIPNVDYLKLFGYFQTYKYFDEYFEDIKQMINLEKQQNAIKEENKNLLGNYYNVSMHFRYGDYRSKQDCHPCMNLNYYVGALNQLIQVLKGNMDNIQIIYFCEADENKFVFDMIKKLQHIFPKLIFTKADDNIEDWKQMLLMSCCHSNILANSSFSLWGAYFNNYKENIVCYPNVWFGHKLSNYNTKDIFKNNWHRIHFST